MGRMIKTVKDFQYSVNIAYDLYNSQKIRAFIPTKASLELLEKILLSTNPESADRARVLIGAYGKGKSHIVLAILSILMKHEPFSDFEHLNKSLCDYPQLKRLVEDYYKSDKKLLPVLVTGSGTSLTQSFLLALKNTLSENNLDSLMPKTNYMAAANTVKKWKKDYPDVLKKFEVLYEKSAEDFICEMKDFNIEAYHKFEELFPELSAGSLFNPFLGFDLVDLYESVAKELRHEKLYSGLYVVYDEFSKYLETNIDSASVNDTKMLQDFAEKACRSGENQLHLLLICHKEISNYIDKLPKQKTDGWRGISERFEHVLLNNDFSQVYEIISNVIQKDSEKWEKYKRTFSEKFELLNSYYGNQKLFEDTFPLHPVSAFILPRLSEQIAQNERTLFTFLSAKGEKTLSSFLSSFSESEFNLLSPDFIFDYFEPLFKKEIYSGDIHNIYHMTLVILDKIKGDDTRFVKLEEKIVKTLSLIYILAQFEKLKPVTEEIVRIYEYSYSKEEIELALKNLIENRFVIYLRQSNSYLKLKETSGLDISSCIHDMLEKQKHTFSLCHILNDFNNENFFYPYRYNDEKEMTRYFAFTFIGADELLDSSEFENIEKTISADGAIFAIVCNSESERKSVRDFLCSDVKKKKLERILFALPKKVLSIEETARKFFALKELCNQASDDEVLLSEYQVVLEDVCQVLFSFVRNYTRPEKKKSLYFLKGENLPIKRQADLTEVLSEICDKVYYKSPIVNNEAINKNTITSIAFNSRRKIIAGLLRCPLEKNLGLIGSGQDVAIMRSTLLYTGLLQQDSESECVSIKMPEKNDSFHLYPMLNEIQKFVDSCAKGKKSFRELYKKLTLAENGIGVRKGLVPIYLALVLGQKKNHSAIYCEEKQVPFTADTLAQINDEPEKFSFVAFTLDDDKRNYLQRLSETFTCSASAKEIFDSMQKWYLSLPKYSREAKTSYSAFINILKSETGEQEFLFKKLPSVFAKEKADLAMALEIEKAKNYYDGLLGKMEKVLEEELSNIFACKNKDNLLPELSLWKKGLSEKTLTHLFSDGAEHLISLLEKKFFSDSSFIQELSFVATGLHLADWNEKSKEEFVARIEEWKEAIESFNSLLSSKENVLEKNGSHFAKGGTYTVSFQSSSGQIIERNFEKVNESARAKLLYNKMTDALETMGHSLSSAEKRQVVMNILQEMCDGLL